MREPDHPRDPRTRDPGAPPLAAPAKSCHRGAILVALALSSGIVFPHSVEAEKARKPARKVLAPKEKGALPSRVKASTRLGLSQAGILVRSSIWHGPKHSAHGIGKRPMLFLATVLGVGAVGVVQNKTGVPLDYVVIAGSTGALGFQLRLGARAVKAAEGADRWRLVGSELVWPTMLWAGTTLGGIYLGHGGEMSHWLAAIRSILLGGDGPMILLQALDPVEVEVDEESPE